MFRPATAVKCTATHAVSAEGTWSTGRHTVTAGGTLRPQRAHVHSQLDARGSFGFTGWATGWDVADFLLGIPLRGMTLVLAAREVSGPPLADLERRLESVPGRGPAPVVVRTLYSHLSKTSLAPSRIATTLVGPSAATAVALGVLGLYGAMTVSVRRRRREIGVRLALGAPVWYVIRQVVSEGARLAAADTLVGMLGSIMVARWLEAVLRHTTSRSNLGVGRSAADADCGRRGCRRAARPPRTEGGPDHDHPHGQL